MLRCRDVAHKASDYIDENLSGGQRFWVKLHLMMCYNCRRFVRHMRITSEYVSRRKSRKATDQQVEEVLTTISRAEFKR